jgi:chromosomal replication initiator protein
MNEFRERYRKSCQALLVDDIQFIAGNKEMTQEEFFHTFNSLHDEKKQIIITSDRFPQEIPGLEDRLRSRFSSGLIVEIKPPNFEERLSILRKKANDASVNLPEEVAAFIAENCQANVRELEGALNQITALASLTGSEISLDVVQETMKNIVKQRGEPVTIDEIIRVTCTFYGQAPGREGARQAEGDYRPEAGGHVHLQKNAKNVFS